MNIAKHVVMLCAFMCNDLGDATCADNQNILFHVGPKTPCFERWGNTSPVRYENCAFVFYERLET